MTNPQSNRKAFTLSAITLVLAYALSLYVAWCGAWLLERWLEHRWTMLRSDDAGQFLYWLMMKLLLWVIPAILIIKATGRTVGEVFALQRVRQIILWGVGIGSLLLITAIATKALSGKPIVSSSLGWPMVNAAVVAPIVEEITFRGAILGSLRRQYRFALANTVTAVLFVGAHLPGWYFQGRLLINLVTPIGGALSIFLLGLIFGWVAQRSESVAASMLAHALNNLGSSL